MFHTSAGNFPLATSKCRNPRTEFWAAPLTFSVADCSGNEVGIPELTCCVCHVDVGIQAAPTIVVVEFHGTVAV
jgi:hypothetical protein